MKKVILLIAFVIIPFFTFSQKQYKISFDDYQLVEDSSTSLKNQMKFPFKDAVVVMGGLNDLDVMNNYFNIFGSNIIVQQQGVNYDGSLSLILRKEDGHNFFDLCSTLSSKLTPLNVLETDKKGRTVATLVRKDGLKFFSFVLTKQSKIIKVDAFL